MANAFLRKTSRDIGVTATQVGAYTVGSGVETTIIGLTVSNTTTSAVEIEVYHRDGSDNDTYLVKGAPVPVGSSLVVVGGDQKVVLEPDDEIYVKSNADTSVDVVMSILEVS